MDYHFEGRLTARDCKRHIAHHFQLPASSAQLELDFQFAPFRVHGVPNLLTLTLFDPQGFRGSRLREMDRDRVHISEGEASPGYLPGPLPRGEWTAEIDTHMIMPGKLLHYALDVTVEEEQQAAGSKQQDESRLAHYVQRPTPAVPGWYRGDLHTHSEHSDAECTLAELAAMARQAELDFFFLTDHNTISGFREIEQVTGSAGNQPGLLIGAGIELTTFWGHALYLGTRQWVDWRVRPGTGEMARLAEAAYAAGQLFVIAHPQSTGDPTCSGCNWRFGEMMPGTAALVEVWNGPWCGDSNSQQALLLWYDWLNQGLHLVATAGSDAHTVHDYAARPGFNVVYAQSLSEGALLEAIGRGHLYLSSGPRVIFEAKDARGKRWIPGDTVPEPVSFHVVWVACPPGAQIRSIANGRLLEQRPAELQGEWDWAMAPEEAAWVLVEIRGVDDELLAVTNPIFLGEN